MQSQLPYDVVRKILFQSRVQEVLNYCRQNREANMICNEQDFWRGYIEINYDMDVLSEALNCDVKNGSIFDCISNLGFPDELSLYSDEIATAIFLENSKIVKFYIRNGGIPTLKSSYLLSKYDLLITLIRGVFPHADVLCGKELVIFNNRNDQISINNIKDPNNFPTLKILNNLPNDISVLKVKDITVEGIPLFDLITKYERN